MSLFYQKAFGDGDEHVRSLRPRAMGNFHRVLAGSYFQADEYSDFVRHAIKSIWYRPGGFGYFLKFPMRRLSRKNRSVRTRFMSKT
jgi:hypothetical protein